MSADLGFVHRYVPGEDESSPTLLLLHGTGGNEEDLVPLGETLAPGAAILSPRGKVSEYGAPRFFRRLAEGVFDHEDLLFRTHELAEFVQAASEEYGFDPSKVVAVGYSNGANVAAEHDPLAPRSAAGRGPVQGHGPIRARSDTRPLRDARVYGCRPCGPYDPTRQHTASR